MEEIFRKRVLTSSATYSKTPMRDTCEKRITKNLTILYTKDRKGDDITYTCECVRGGNRVVSAIPATVPELSWEEIERIPHFVNFVDRQITIEADALAQELVDAWAQIIQKGNHEERSTDFKTLFDKCCIYRDARRIANNRRKFNLLSVEQAADEE
jgi:hypothetical protein